METWGGMIGVAGTWSSKVTKTGADILERWSLMKMQGEKEG